MGQGLAYRFACVLNAHKNNIVGVQHGQKGISLVPVAVQFWRVSTCCRGRLLLAWLLALKVFNEHVRHLYVFAKAFALADNVRGNFHGRLAHNTRAFVVVTVATSATVPAVAVLAWLRNFKLVPFCPRRSRTLPRLQRCTVGLVTCSRFRLGRRSPTVRCFCKTWCRRWPSSRRFRAFAQFYLFA